VFFYIGSASGQVMNFKIPIGEASGIACLPNGNFLIIDDEEGVFFFDPQKQKVWPALSSHQYESLDDLEGITISTDQKNVYLLSEDGGRIFVSNLASGTQGVQLQEPQLLGSLAMIGNEKNKGYEGICIIILDGKDHLLAVHQDKPMALAIFSLPDLKKVTMCKLPGDLEELQKNLSDVTVDLRNGHILLISAKSRRIVEVKARIDKDIEELEIVSTIRIDGNLSGKPEGLCFDAYERLVVVTDASGDEGDFIRFDK
jgi:uncharacterized protein YjiK